MRNSVCLLFSIALSACLGIGCAGSLKAEKNAGFLKNYSQMQPGPSGGVAKVYMKPGADLKKYNKIMFDQVVFYFKDDAANKAVDPQEMQELSQTFHKAVVAAINNAYPLVAQPGPDVMRVRVAITGYDPPYQVLNTISTVVPVGLGLSLVKQGVTGKGTGCGEISMEFEFLDSQTSEVIASGIDRRAGGKVESMTKFGTADEAFKFWAQRLRTRLDEAHGK